MKYIAVLGFGIVGGGIPTVIETDYKKIEKAVGDGVEIKYILDLRDFPDSPYASKIVHDINIILEDEQVTAVCEVMGGSHPAYEFSVACMKAGKSVVTSNKEVVANFGDSLLECARENGVHYLFEASVGGGIPVLRSFATSLAGEEIKSVTGIVNGTTNYILTRMKEAGLSFGDALGEAQALGFAEKNPAADIDGIDAQRKIIILTALASGKLIPGETVHTETLRNITSEDTESAELLDGEIKLIARAEFFDDGTISACVAPMIVPHTSILSHISDVFNGISVDCKTLGEVMYFGKGAGRIATAGAVVADICAVLSGSADGEAVPAFEKAADDGNHVRNYMEQKYDWCVTASSTVEELRTALESYDTEIDVITGRGARVRITARGLTAGELEDALSGIDGVSYIRIM
ncbi:MAG: homoserine dehydrogenase [Eubacteriales bacterium]